MKCTEGTYKCEYEEEDYYDEAITFHNHDVGGNFEEDTELISARHSNTFYIMTMVPMLIVVLLCVIVVVFVLVKKGKKKYVYGTSRSFSNPNYYSSNNEANSAQGNDRKQFIWKRLKYDKSQVCILKNVHYILVFLNVIHV